MNKKKIKITKTVLIVDDEKLFLASLKEGMTTLAEEFIVLTATNGHKAIEVLQSNNVDLVVTDLKMPVMDGFELLAYMLSNYPHIPALVMTAFGTPEIEKRIQDLDAYDYVEKPIDFQVLADKIHAGIHKHSDGHITGIMLFSFLQMLQIEQKTCVLKITSQSRKGTLYFSKGEMVDALYGKITGKEAAYEIACWEDSEIELVNMTKSFPNNIKQPLQNILMEAARRKDEKAVADFRQPDFNQEIQQLNPKDKKSTDNSPRAIPRQSRLADEANQQSTVVENINKSPIEATNLNQCIKTKETNKKMANNVNQSLEELMSIEGAMAVALADSNSGMALGSVGTGVNLEVAAAGNSEVIKSKERVMSSLGLKDKIEDILISLGTQYHLIRPLATHPHLFFYVVLNRKTSNLAMARFKLSDIEARVEV